MRKKTATAYVYAIPAEILPEDAKPSTAVPSTTAAIPSKDIVRILRCDNEGLVASRFADLFKWFATTLKNEDVDGDTFITASLAIPTLSLSVEYWGRAAQMLSDKLAEFDVVIGNVFHPKRIKLNDDNKFFVADWYTAFYSGTLRQDVVEYTNKRTEVMTPKKIKDDESLDSELQ
jgi:hypothetical protein